MMKVEILKKTSKIKMKKEKFKDWFSAVSFQPRADR